MSFSEAQKKKCEQITCYMLVASVVFSCGFMKAPNSAVLIGSLFQLFISVHGVNHVLDELTGHGTCRTGTDEWLA